jgi:hypothetical protein
MAILMTMMRMISWMMTVRDLIYFNTNLKPRFGRRR